MQWVLFLFFFFYFQLAFSFCFDEAGKHFDINPNLLMAIAFTESEFNSNAINHNKRNNKIVSTDYGLMQINSWWFSYFKKKGVKAKEIKTNPCINVFVGAYILNHNFELAGKNWDAVGAYNAGFRKTKKLNKIRKKYISVVRENFEEFESE